MLQTKRLAWLNERELIAFRTSQENLILPVTLASPKEDRHYAIYKKVGGHKSDASYFRTSTTIMDNPIGYLLNIQQDLQQDLHKT